MDEENHEILQQNNQFNSEINRNTIIENLLQKQIKFIPPTKNPNQVFDKNILTENKPQFKKQMENVQQDDNKSVTSQKSNKSGQSLQRKRKGSFLQKLSQKQQQQQQRIKQMKKNDAKSIFIENVDYKTTKQQLELIFQDCGKIARVTILKDPFTNHPKGCAYVSFQTQEGVQRSLYLSGVSLRNRTIKVHRKRTNLPGHNKGKKQDMTKNFLGMMQSYTMGAMRGGRGRGRGR